MPSVACGGFVLLTESTRMETPRTSDKRMNSDAWNRSFVKGYSLGVKSKKTFTLTKISAFMPCLCQEVDCRPVWISVR